MEAVMARPGPAVLLVLSLCLLTPWTAWAAGVRVLFDVSSPGAGPFPSDLFTVSDPSHRTGRRVNLPKPDCVLRPSDCADVDVLNTLDGFNLQSRLSIPFSGAIDVTSVSSRSVFLVRLGRAGHPSHLERSRDSEDRDDDESGHGGGREHGRSGDSEDQDEDESGHVVGINQVVWDPATNTLHAESDELLDQHTRYALIVTNGVRDEAGNRVEAGDFDRFRRHLSVGQARDPGLKAYRQALLDALARVDRRRARVVAASVFTTQSATAVLEKIRDQIKAHTPAPADFNIGSGGTRTVFPLAGVSAILFQRQVKTSLADPTAFSTSAMITPALGIIPGAVTHLAFGTYRSPDYETPGKFIPAVGTRSGTPAVQAVSDVYFNLFLPGPPRCTKPPAGWPVAIFGHGFGDNRNNSPLAVAASMGAQCLATIAINVVGHGGGPAGTLIVNPGLSQVTLAAGGRGIDQDGNGIIDSTEGVNAAFPWTIISNRDGLRQTVVDLMQLVRVIETGGIDADGDRFPDLDGSRIYYFGQSFGGIYGTIFLGVEPSVRVGVPNVPGGPIIEVARLSPVFRPLVSFGLSRRVPNLTNLPPVGPVPQFDENLPLRDQPVVIKTVPGAMAIQEVIEHTEWVSQSGNPVAYAPYLRKDPLDGILAKKVIFQFARGDQTVPNPTTTNILRAGDLGRRTTYFRNDLVFAIRSGVPRNPHTFLTNIGVPAMADLAVAAQSQIAVFFASDGKLRTDPDRAGPFFEVPIEDDLPETLSFLP
jgi:hypothetical protein